MTDSETGITIWKEDDPKVLKCLVSIFHDDLLALPPVEVMKCRGWLIGTDDKDRPPSVMLSDFVELLKVLEKHQETLP